jgi:hypothetical protein
MYVNPFVAGVLVTVMAELIIVIAGALIVNANNKRK